MAANSCADKFSSGECRNNRYQEPNRREGTHTGLFLGVAPTGKKVTFETADIYRAQDGLFVEHWDVIDKLSIATELGLFGVTQERMTVSHIQRPTFDRSPPTPLFRCWRRRRGQCCVGWGLSGLEVNFSGVFLRSTV